MTAMIEHGLGSMRSVGGCGLDGDGVHDTFEHFIPGLERLLDRVLVVMIAAQSDAELRISVARYVSTNDLGPHRGIRALGGYLRSAQLNGTIRDDVDPQAVAFFLISSASPGSA